MYLLLTNSVGEFYFLSQILGSDLWILWGRMSIYCNVGNVEVVYIILIWLSYVLKLGEHFWLQFELSVDFDARAWRHHWMLVINIKNTWQIDIQVCFAGNHFFLLG